MIQQMNRVEYLVKEITMHDNSYWKLNCPDIPDEDYDKLVNELKNVEERRTKKFETDVEK